MNQDEKAYQVAHTMLQTDTFSQWMGITILEARYGYCKIQMTVRGDMLNGFGVGHGGITFSVADSALAFACNSDGRTTLALEANISFTKTVKQGETLTAEAKQINKTKRTGLYMIEVKNQREELVALFKGSSYTLEER